jgi:hypothetical protein
MVVQAIDCNATQCNPIAQQSALIVAMRPTQRSTMARLVGVPVRVKQGKQGYVRLKHKSNFLEIAGAEFTET